MRYTLPGLLTCILASFSTAALSQIAAGSYTIGGASPDYATFTAAVTDLNTNGLAGDGPVIFNVRDGTYTEALSINQVTNADATSTITFKSENNDSSLVVLTHASATATLVLNGADYVTFKWMTIETTGLKRVVDLVGGATNNKFLNCRINGYYNTGTSYSYSLFYSTSTATLDDNNEYRNNVMTNGTYAIVLLGASSTTETGTVITGNAFINQGGYGLKLNYNDGVNISNNTFTTDVSTIHYAIYLSYCDGALSVKKNQIWKTTAGQGYGIYMTQCKATAGNESEVSNNFIQVIGTSGNGYGIYSTFSEYVNFYFNNINSTHTSTTQSALYTTGGGTATLTIKNNIFVNTGGGYAIYIATTSAIAGIDYNDYFATGTNLGYWSGAKTTLAAWQTATGDDANSVSIDPLYVDVANGDLHIAEAVLEGAGVALASPLDDFDNAVRPDPPTIGADEKGTGAANDAGVISVDQPSVPFAAGSQNVFVTIKNFGSSTLTSATIKWSVNAVAQTDYNWTGTIASNATSASFSIGSYSFTAGVSHRIIAWTTLPNGGADGNAANDQITRGNVVPALVGTYTIGSGGTFANWTGAIDTLANHGIVGAVTLNVKAATYIEQASIPVIAGSSSANTITFQSETGDSTDVTLSHASSTGIADNYTLQLNGTDYVTLSKMTIERTGTNNYARVIDLTGNAHNITIQNCQVFGRAGGSGDAQSAIYSGPVNIDDTAIAIYRNWIRDGYHGIYMEGASANLKRTLDISNNKLENYRYGIYLKYMENVSIYKNQIINAATTNGAATQGLYLFHCDSMLLIRKNNIIMTAGTNNYGMDILASETSYIGGKKGEISNNMIVVGGTGTSTGIYCNASTNKNFYYNGILTTGTNATSSRALYVNGPSSGTPSLNANFIVKNNIFMATDGKALYNSVGGINECNYNNYYVAAATDIAYWKTGAMADLAALQAANSDDANSISADPLFVSGTDPFDLHITSSSPCINAAVDIPGLTDDIEDELRATDIGADEKSGVLPVKLLHFTGTRQETTVRLKWITVSEVNNDFFTVERSRSSEPGAFQWMDIGTVKGAGNSNTVREYSILDDMPVEEAGLYDHRLAQIVYYRLKQTDYDGSYDHSGVVAVSLESEPGISILPNPTTGMVNIFLVEAQNASGLPHCSLTIRSLLGETIVSESLYADPGAAAIRYDMTQFGKGLYLINVKSATMAISTRIIVY